MMTFCGTYRLEELLLDQLPRVDTTSWTPFCELAIMVIYHLSETPDVVCAKLLKKLTNVMLGGSADGGEGKS